MNYKKFNLKENPFRLVPPLNPDEIIWVGMEDLKLDIEDRLRIALRTSNSRIILNWGDYGSGKTHAANYYSRTNRLKELSDQFATSQAKSIKVNLPRTSKDIVQAFLRSLLGQISVDSIVSDFKQLKEILQDDFENVVVANSNDKIIEDLFIKLANEDDTQDLNVIQNYLYGDKTKATLRELNVPYGLVDDEQVVNLIGTIFSCLTYNKKPYSAIILWIDEFEDIDTVSKSIADRFTTFLRQLIDKTPNNLTIFLNFTPKTFFDIEDLSIYLGPALSSRTKQRIYFDEPSQAEAIDYLQKLLKCFRTQEVAGNDLYPFSKEIVVYVLEHIGQLTIRKINEAFSIILEFALIDNVDDITIDFVKNIKEEIISWEEQN